MGLKKNHYLVCRNETLGVLEYGGSDMRWIWGEFKKRPAFEKYEELFLEIEKLTREIDEDDDEPVPGKFIALDNKLDLLMTKVEEMELQVKNQDGTYFKIRDFKIHEGCYEYQFDD